MEPVKKETPWAKQKRLLLEAKQQLFLVATDPESPAAQSIIFEQKVLKAQGENMMRGSYWDHIKKIGLGISRQIKPFSHYEEPKKQ